MLDTVPNKAITAVVLAGGQGMRMGGLDKGLQLFNGLPLAQHALHRLQPQVNKLIVNANRNISAYQSFGFPVYCDDNALGAFAGPLAGVITALQQCTTPYLLTVPCDAPLFPADLAARLAAALAAGNAEIAVVSAPESGDSSSICRPQPVFSLMEVGMLKSLQHYTQAGGRKVSAWMDQHRVAYAAFKNPHDAPDAFFNANTLTELSVIQNTNNLRDL